MQLPEREKLCLLICNHYKREAELLLNTQDYPDVCVQPYATACIFSQQTQAVRDQVARLLQDNDQDVVLVGGCFLSNSNLASFFSEHCRVYHEEQCFYMLAPQALVDETQRSGAYMVSPGWLIDWQNMLKSWGFDQETARCFFGECTTSLVMLDTGIDDRSREHLQSLGTYLNLPVQILPVGLEPLRLYLDRIILKWRLEKCRIQNEQIRTVTNRKLADQAMALDLLVGLTHIHNEMEAIKYIVKLFVMLFAPQTVYYASLVQGVIKSISIYPLEKEVSDQHKQEMQSWLDQNTDTMIWTEADQEFFLKLSYQGNDLGLLRAQNMAFPDYITAYTSLVTSLAPICGLALANARMFQEMQYMAVTDSLTGLNNRRYFFAQALAEFIRAERYSRPLTAIMLDIDHFKVVNDTYGHAAGDQVLVAVAQSCREELRSTDLQGRYGGEEFVFLMPETTKEQALLVAERLRVHIAEQVITVSAQIIRITVSLGLAERDKNCLNLETLLNKSDQALYSAKQQGRNRVCCWQA